jgi:hypothetical protein
MDTTAGPAFWAACTTALRRELAIWSWGEAAVWTMLGPTVKSDPSGDRACSVEDGERKNPETKSSSTTRAPTIIPQRTEPNTTRTLLLPSDDILRSSPSDIKRSGWLPQTRPYPDLNSLD